VLKKSIRLKFTVHNAQFSYFCMVVLAISLNT